MSNKKPSIGTVRRELQECRARAEALDLRRRNQIKNQIASINRLMTGASYDTEMAALHSLLAEVEAQRDELVAAIGEVKSSMLASIGNAKTEAHV